MQGGDGWGEVSHSGQEGVGSGGERYTKIPAAHDPGTHVQCTVHISAEMYCVCILYVCI